MTDYINEMMERGRAEIKGMSTAGKEALRDCVMNGILGIAGLARLKRWHDIPDACRTFEHKFLALLEKGT